MRPLTALAMNPPQRRLLAITEGSVHQPHPLSRVDNCDIDGVLAALPDNRSWRASFRVRGAGESLGWLETFPGDGWQDRWLAADVQKRSLREVVVPGGDDRVYEQLMEGMRCLLLGRVFRPSYT